MNLSSGVVPSIRERDPEQEPVEGTENQTLYSQPKRLLHVLSPLTDELEPDKVVSWPPELPEKAVDVLKE